MQLDLGCSASKTKGYIGVDSLILIVVDIVRNLNSFPYSSKTNGVEETIMDQV